MKISDDAKAIVAANIVNAAATIQLASSYNGHKINIESCVKTALERYKALLDNM